METLRIVVEQVSGERLATVELEEDSTVGQLKRAVFAVCPTSTGAFFELILEGIELCDDAETLDEAVCRLGWVDFDELVVQLVVVEPQITATLELETFESRHTMDKECDICTERTYKASLRPCDIDEFTRAYQASLDHMDNSGITCWEEMDDSGITCWEDEDMTVSLCSDFRREVNSRGLGYRHSEILHFSFSDIMSIMKGKHKHEGKVSYNGMIENQYVPFDEMSSKVLKSEREIWSFVQSGVELEDPDNYCDYRVHSGYLFRLARSYKEPGDSREREVEEEEERHVFLVNGHLLQLSKVTREYYDP